MKQFVISPIDKNGGKKTVNLKEVSNIAFTQEYNRAGDLYYKIIFNFDYGISLRGNNGKIIADYCYFVYNDYNDYEKMEEKLSDLINEKGWIAPIVNGSVSRIVNPDKISFMATDTRKNRIILNLSTSVSFYNDFSKKTSDFIYFDFNTLDEYKENLVYIQDQLDITF